MTFLTPLDWLMVMSTSPQMVYIVQYQTMNLNKISFKSSAVTCPNVLVTINFAFVQNKLSSKFRLKLLLISSKVWSWPLQDPITQLIERWMLDRKLQLEAAGNVQVWYKCLTHLHLGPQSLSIDLGGKYLGGSIEITILSSSWPLPGQPDQT